MLLFAIAYGMHALPGPHRLVCRVKVLLICQRECVRARSEAWLRCILIMPAHLQRPFWALAVSAFLPPSWTPGSQMSSGKLW